ncbi:hypothetical protein AB0P21_30955 [Kribbella sp. NPDC056861]|uniref:hypothetical protein n=1 Tax=Kribbella sp. NPDC056861 TaxID=3154857 RepID=UPI0034266972
MSDDLIDQVQPRLPNAVFIDAIEPTDLAPGILRRGLPSNGFGRASSTWSRG